MNRNLSLIDRLSHLGVPQIVIDGAGGWPVPFFKIPMERLKEIIKEAPRLKIMEYKENKAINREKLLSKILAGGIRMPHLHLEDEIVLLDKKTFQNYLKAAAEEVSKIKDITEIEEYIKA